MILTPLAARDLTTAFDAYQSHLATTPMAQAVCRRIQASEHDVAALADRHREAVALTQHFGMAPIDEAPQAAFSWDGCHVRTRSEPWVVIHEVAHFQVSSPARRFRPDFGLGAGPETGWIAAADRARTLGEEARQVEEQLASLLGILWEVELGQPGIHAFLEQNWLEGAERPSSAAFFCRTLDRLVELGLVDADGHPHVTLRISPDA